MKEEKKERTYIINNGKHKITIYYSFTKKKKLFTIKLLLTCLMW